MPDDVVEYKVSKKNRKPIPFKVAGDDLVYKFTPPKNISMLMEVLDSEEDSDIAQIRATFDWLGKGLSEDQMEHLKARFLDDKDDIDVDDLGEIVEQLQETISGRPTT